MSCENFSRIFPEKNILKRLYITIFFFIFALDIKYIITNNYASFYYRNTDYFAFNNLLYSIILITFAI